MDLVYIIDELSVGLYLEDIVKINEILKFLKDKGNIVLIVEYDFDVIKEGDYIIDMGLGLGKNGGEIIFEGIYNELLFLNIFIGNVLCNKYNLKENICEVNYFYNIGFVI